MWAEFYPTKLVLSQGRIVVAAQEGQQRRRLRGNHQHATPRFALDHRGGHEHLDLILVGPPSFLPNLQAKARDLTMSTATVLQRLRHQVQDHVATALYQGCRVR